MSYQKWYKKRRHKKEQWGQLIIICGQPLQAMYSKTEASSSLMALGKQTELDVKEDKLRNTNNHTLVERETKLLVLLN